MFKKNQSNNNNNNKYNNNNNVCRSNFSNYCYLWNWRTYNRYLQGLRKRPYRPFEHGAQAQYQDPSWRIIPFQTFLRGN